MPKITKKNNPDLFDELCKELHIEYPSTIHHFESDATGVFRPVEWGEIKSTDVPQAR